MEKPYIGIMIGSLLFNKIKRGKQLPILSFYEEAGELNNIIPCFFRLEDLYIEKDWILSLVRIRSENSYKKCLIPRPKVIHNRAYHCLNADKKKILRLQEDGIVFYNDWNFYGKLKMDEMLRENPAIIPFLPETVLFNKKNMERMMEEYQELIVKPNKGSLGKRNMKVSKKNKTEWVLDYLDGPEKVSETFTKDSWPKHLNDHTAESKYLIQERIALAEYMGSPFDIRVSIQRNGTGNWQITGMVAKVAQTGNFVTNVARGGTCFPVSDIVMNLPGLDVRQVCQHVEQLAFMCAGQLAGFLPNLADIGLDIGITDHGFPMFIECNARDLRYSFQRANLMAEWKSSYITPVSYGKYLLDLQEKEPDRMRDES